MELLQHLFGFCPDHASHLNLLDAFFGTGGLAFVGMGYYRVKGWWQSRHDKKANPPSDEA